MVGWVSRFAFAAAILLLCSASAFAEEQVVPPASRDVTPPGFTPAPGGNGPLVREPVPPPPPSPPRWHRFNLPVTTDAATFIAEKRQIAVAGVVPLPRIAVCETTTGDTWPCGEVALWSLRRFLLGRSIECWFGPADTGNPLTVACRVGKTDIGLWLVSQGWAKAADNASDAYQQAATAARCAHRGLWRGATPGPNCPAEN